MSRPGTPAPLPPELLADEDGAVDEHAPTPLDERTEHLQRLATLGTLAAGSAHEINHVVMHLLSSLDHVARAWEQMRPTADAAGDVGDDLAAAVQQSQSCATRLRDLARTMTDCARPADAQPAVTQINAVVHNAIGLVGPMLRQQAQLATDLERDLPALLGHPTKLAQVVVNLLVNAMHATEDLDPRDAVVRVQTRQTSRALELVVTDNGCGIEGANLQRALDPFFTTKPAGQGTGLGLALCRQIVEDHRGSIAIDSQRGVGTTVTITLPL